MKEEKDLCDICQTLMVAWVDGKLARNGRRRTVTYEHFLIAGENYKKTYVLCSSVCEKKASEEFDRLIVEEESHLQEVQKKGLDAIKRISEKIKEKKDQLVSDTVAVSVDNGDHPPLTAQNLQRITNGTHKDS